MKFAKQLVKDATSVIKRELQSAVASNERVLWLVSGGSNIPIEVEIMASISKEASKNLAIMPIDERFGPIGYEDSNLQQLQKAGFDAKDAIVVPVLHPMLDFASTVELYEKAVETAFNRADVIIGQLGMGADGHIAGILPGSEAIRQTKSLVVGYKGPDYQRITITAAAIQKFDMTYVLAYGTSKKAALEQLSKGNLTFSKQPAALLKKLKQCIVFNDQIGEKS